MKTAAWILASLVVLALLLVPLVAGRAAHHWSDCTGRVVMLRGPQGEPIECVCHAGTMSTCFAPGP